MTLAAIIPAEKNTLVASMLRIHGNAGGEVLTSGVDFLKWFPCFLKIEFIQSGKFANKLS